MNSKIKLSIALVMGLMLIACDGGGGKPVKTVKVWKNVKEVKTNSTDGSTSYILTNTYDKNGFLIRQDHDGDANGQTDSELRDHYITYSYDNNGVLSKKTFYRASGSKSADALMDEHGRYTETTSYDKNGAITSTTLVVNTYDDKKRIIKEEISDKNAPVRRVIVFTYEGNIETQKYDTDMDGQTDDVTYILTSNDKGELIKKERSAKNQAHTHTEEYTYEYDENDNIKTKSILINGYTSVITYTLEKRSVPEKYAE